MKKYEIDVNQKKNWRGHTLYRIKACVDFFIFDHEIKSGELGGWIEKKENLSQDGTAWVNENAMVYGNAQVYDNAVVEENAIIYGNAKVYNSAMIYGNAKVYGNARVFEQSRVNGSAKVYDNVKIRGRAEVCGNAKVFENAVVDDRAVVSENARVFNDTVIYQDAEVFDDAKVYGNAKIYGRTTISGNAEVFGDVEIFGNADISGNACIFLPEHFMCVSPFPVEGFSETLTLFRTEDCQICVQFGENEKFDVKSIDEFKSVIDAFDEPRDRIVAMAAVELGKRCIDLTPQKIDKGETV